MPSRWVDHDNIERNLEVQTPRLHRQRGELVEILRYLAIVEAVRRDYCQTPTRTWLIISSGLPARKQCFGKLWILPGRGRHVGPRERRRRRVTTRSFRRRRRQRSEFNPELCPLLQWLRGTRPHWQPDQIEPLVDYFAAGLPTSCPPTATWYRPPSSAASTAGSYNGLSGKGMWERTRWSRTEELAFVGAPGPVAT
jgi:hypothetical protein